jgi:hypothetical protein
MTILLRLFRGRLACPSAVFASILFSATLATASRACVTATSGGSWQNTAMTSQTGTFTATFDATPSASPTNSVVGLSNGAQTAYANFACLARFNPTGQIDAYNGTAYAAASTINYSAGVSYHFRLVVNIAAKTYSVYVTPTGGSELTVGLNYAFRLSTTTLNYWGVYVSSTSGGTGTDTVCNFSTGGTITTYTITASAGSGGSISPSGTVTVNQGANQSFTITPSSGFNVSSVTVDGTSQGAITSYTFSNVQAAHTISASFQQQSSGEGPFGGTPAAIPGTVQAENYDTGGQGVAYNVTSINGTDNGYRSDGVDLEVCSDTGGGVDLGWESPGQWFKYTVNVATAGTYTVSFRVAAPNAVTDAFHLSNSAGTNLSGNVNVPATGGYQTWATVTANVTLPAGQQILTLNQDTGGGVWNINYASFAQQITTFTITASAGSGGSISPSGTVTVNQGANQSFTITPNSGFNVSSVTVDGANQGVITSYTFSNVQAAHTISAAFQQQSSEGPYGGTPAAIPGTVQAENYDTGGQGVAYNVGSINGTDNGYRSDGVDLEVCSDTGGGVDLGWTFGGDWFKYTVKVATAGTYTVSFRVAGPSAVTDAFHLANASGTNLSGSVNVPATGGYQTWTTVTANVTLPAGQQVLTLDQDNGGWNINYLGFAQQVPTFTITASAGSNGSISPSGTVTVNQGANQSFTITPNSGFNISSVTVDGASQGAITTYTFSNVTANHTISATFASSGGLNPNVPPGQNFNLANWELDLPTGSSGNIDIITQPQLATFTDAYFYTDPNDGAMTFFCPENGVHTTNSSFPRSELRELNPGGDWPLTGTNIQTATLKVEDTLAHVAIGQIHIGNGGTPTSTKPLLELFYYSTGQITLLLETSPSGGGPETNVTTVPLGQKFSYTIKTVGNALTIIVNGVTQNYTINSSYNSERFYFKAGDYLQTTGSSSTVGAHVAFYALNVTHQ